MRTITISGNVGKDPEVRSTQNGLMVANFSVAVRQNRQGDDGRYGTDWFRCSVWGNRAKVIQQYFQKGSHVVVSGDLEVSEYNGQTQLGVNVSDFDLPDRNGATAPANASAPSVNNNDSVTINDDDLPF